MRLKRLVPLRNDDRIDNATIQHHERIMEENGGFLKFLRSLLLFLRQPLICEMKLHWGGGSLVLGRLN